MQSPSPRLLAFLLIAAGAMGVLVLSFRPSRVVREAAPPAVKSATPFPSPVREPEEPEPQLPHGPEENETEVPDDQLDPNLARPEAGTGEAYLGHLARSAIEANATALQLDPAQQQKLIEDFLEFQEVHAELAAQHLQEAGYDGATLTAHVPPFLSEGKALRDVFYARLRSDFPGAAYDRVTEELAPFFDAHFRGYGISEQSFTITRSAQHPDAFQIEWQAQPVEGQTPSRGAEETSYAGSSGVVLYSRDQIKNGEFRFLGELIDQRFPGPG